MGTHEVSVPVAVQPVGLCWSLALLQQPGYSFQFVSEYNGITCNNCGNIKVSENDMLQVPLCVYQHLTGQP